MADYTRKLERLRGRRQDLITKSFSLSESFSRSTYGVSTKYALEAMEPIDKTYTENTYKSAERVQNQLFSGLNEYGIGVEFRYQGSVPTNTHIKNYSDIDVLCLYTGFHTLEAPQTPQFPYLGNPVEDLKNMRKKMFRILDTVYTGCDIDDEGSKALSISGGSLNRKIDLIPSNWYITNKYTETKDEDYKGIYILDRENNTRIMNKPFMHMYWINHKDSQVLGNEKRLIRLLKTVKVDADEEIKLSNYDIASIVYRMDNNEMFFDKTERLKLLYNCNEYLKRLIANSELRNSLYVPNGTRKIFSSDGAKLEELIKLQKEFQELVVSISTELVPLNESLQKSNIYY